MHDKTGNEKKTTITVSRRDFMKFSGMAVIGVCFCGCEIDSLGQEKATWGFLLADMKKCQGCQSCMLACSLAHEGVENPCLSRIQIVQDSLGAWPDDVTVSQCRQCVEPACLAACPTGALHRDANYGDVATVDAEKCIGCRLCVSACPYAPGRAIWNFQDLHSQKCDLCAVTPHWKEQGGPDGKKACVEVCPIGALAFTKIIPDQESATGYTINLRNWEWKKLGFPLV